MRTERRLVAVLDESVPDSSPIGRLSAAARGIASIDEPVWKEIQLEPLSDAELIAQHLAATDRDGGGAWVDELFRRHYQKVVCWCLRFAGNRDDAYDVAQGIFVKAYRNLESFRGDSKVPTWLYSITRSECINFLKARSARPERAREELLEELPDGDGSSADRILEREGSARIVRALLD